MLFDIANVPGVLNVILRIGCASDVPEPTMVLLPAPTNAIVPVLFGAEVRAVPFIVNEPVTFIVPR